MLTATEHRAIQELPPIYQEFLNAKFKTRLSVYSGYDLQVLVKELVNDILFSSGIKDRSDPNVKDYLTKTLTEDLQHPRFASVTFDEVEIACKKGVRQEYGAFMGVNIQTIHSWLRSYLNSKDRELAIREFYSKISELEGVKEDKMSPINPEGQKKVIEIIKAIIKKVPEEEVKKTEKLLKQAKEKSPRDEFIQKCFRDHHAIWEKTPAKDRIIDERTKTVTIKDYPGRYILYEGKPVDEIEYTQILLTQYDNQKI